MQKILILSFTDLSVDPRPLKQIKLLRDVYEITTVGNKPSGYEHKFIKYHKEPLLKEIYRFLLLLLKRDYEKYYWSENNLILKKKLKCENYDLIIAHDERTLPIAQDISSHAKIILDAHEYFPDVFKGSIFGSIQKDYIQFLYKKIIKKPDAMLTVSNGISKKYYKDYHFNSDVIMNLPQSMELTPSEVEMNKVKIVHHGSASPTRKIDKMIKMMDYLDKSYHMDLMLVYTRSNYFYMLKLKILAKIRKNVSIIDPVPFNKIISKLNHYDIGLFLLPPTNYSLEYSLPNKFFEFIQARLAIAIGPSPEMANIVKKYDIGVVADNYTPQALASKICSLSREQINLLKHKSGMIAQKFSYQQEELKLLSIIKDVLN